MGYLSIFSVPRLPTSSPQKSRNEGRSCQGQSRGNRFVHFRREIMSSLLFPTLLELYRCDESSSFKGLDGYYRSSAAYQSYLKHRRNPYRSADGKKLTHANVHI